MVKGSINGIEFQTPLEPDGKGGHWFSPSEHLLKQLNVKVGDELKLELEVTKDWTEPVIPEDIKRALNKNPQILAMWNQDITPLARWEWVRWIRSTGNNETRNRRIEVAISKMRSGKRRPCCWNRNICSEPEVSKNGLLLEPQY